jgi:hypothetical protein
MNGILLKFRFDEKDITVVDQIQEVFSMFIAHKIL